MTATTVLAFAGAGAAVAVPAGAPRPATQCVGSNFATLGNIYDAMFDSLLPQMPAQVRRDAPTIKTQAHRAMDRLRISPLAVSNDPRALGASETSPSLKYRDPVSNYIVTQLMNVRRGIAYQAITVDRMTLSQAVETVYLYLYATVFIPLNLIAGTIPAIAPVGPVSLGLLISLPLRVGGLASDLIYGAIRDELIHACVASVTLEQKNRAGKTVRDLRFPNRVPGMIADIARQVDIAEDKTCPAIGTLPLSRIVDRTARYLDATTVNTRVDRQIDDQTSRLLTFMKNTRVPHNLIPSDPKDFSLIERLLDYGLGFVPYAGGAPIEVVIGLLHSRAEGLDFGQTVALSDLTVTKSLTAAYYAYALSTHVLKLGYDQGDAVTVSALRLLLPGVPDAQLANLVPGPDGLLDAPSTYGLVTFHNVLRSMCLGEDKVG